MTGRTVLLGGESVRLAEKPLKAGGQAAVYPIEGRPGHVVKIYREPPGAQQERRLQRMLTMAPLGGRPTHQSQPPELAWPTALAHSPEGRFLGYAMHRFGEPEHVQLIGLFTRSVRLRLFPERDWKFLLGVSWNLAFMTARMHHEHLVIGDFSANNVVVDKDGFVTFLDCDSIDFTDVKTKEHFPCLMHTADYCSPERQRGGPATPAGDDFALAVLVYQLLAGGNHPYGGVPHDSDSEATVKDNIANSVSYVVRPDRVMVPRTVIDPSVLPPSLLQLARDAFGPGADDPSKRPTSEDWLRALDQERSQVQVCTARPRHKYGSHLPACPWCERAAATGQDLFNPAATQQRQPRTHTVSRPIPTVTPAQPSPLGQLSPEARAALVVAAIVVLLVLLGLATLLAG